MSETAGAVNTERSLTRNSILARGADVQPTQDSPAEEWRPVVGYEGCYDVSSLGRVWSRPRFGAKGGILKPHLARGYLMVNPSQNGQHQTAPVHRLVAFAFIGARPEGLEIRHLDGNPLNNSVANLAYGTPAENFADMVRHGRSPRMNQTHCKHGHPFDEANTLYYPGTPNHRRCRECIKASRARLREVGSDIPHGTLYRYTTFGCRCDECKLARNAYYRANRLRNKVAA